MKIDVQRRAKLLRESLENIKEAETIRCTGMEDKNLCTDLISRNLFSCEGCRAIDLVETSIEIDSLGNGVIRKERSS